MHYFSTLVNSLLLYVRVKEYSHSRWRFSYGWMWVLLNGWSLLTYWMEPGRRARLSLSNAIRHFATITHHKIVVANHCFRSGLYRQGLTHDLSKYSFTEFRIGMKYYTGIKSPNSGERQELGYSTAWLHHKGRNRHHFEYWIDIKNNSRRQENAYTLCGRDVLWSCCGQ